MAPRKIKVNPGELIGTVSMFGGSIDIPELLKKLETASDINKLQNSINLRETIKRCNYCVQIFHDFQNRKKYMLTSK